MCPWPFISGNNSKRLKRHHVSSISSVDDDGESVESEENLSGYYSKSAGGLQPHSWQGDHIEPGPLFSPHYPKGSDK